MTKDKINRNYLQMYSLHRLDSIEGNLKFEKVCYELKKSLLDSGHSCGSNFEFKRDDFGPRDPGISKANKKYDMMGLIEIQEELEQKPKTYLIKEKGKLWVESLTKYFSRTESEFNEVVDVMDKSLDENKDLKGYQIVQKDSIQKTKKEMFGKKI